MIEAAKEAKAIEERLEPIEGIDKSIQLEAAYAQSRKMLLDMDSNHDERIQSPLSYH